MNGGELNQPWQKGDELTASRLEAMRRGIVAGDADGGGLFQDSTGRYRRRQYQQGIELWEVYSCTLDSESHEYQVEAYPVYLDEDTRTWRSNTSADLETLWFPTLPHDQDYPYGALGPQPFWPRQRVYTRLLDGRRCILSPPENEWRFKLTEALGLEGESAAAVLVTYDGSNTTDTEYVIEVHNPFHMFEGASGAYGYARLFGDSTKLEITQMVCP